MEPLARRRSLPPGGVPATLDIAGWPLRAMAWPGGPRGSLLVVNGRGDFIEKYAESLWDWIDRGWSVATFDWRGQGRSGRLGDDAHKGHCDTLDTLLADFTEIIRWFRAMLPGPHHVVAHSMGGHLTLRHLVSGGRDFERAVLLAPMLGIAAARSPLHALAARAMRLLGRDGRYLPGGGPYRGHVAGSPRQLLLTTDSERYLDEPWWHETQPGLVVGGVTWGWLAAAHASLAALTAPGRLEAIRTPVLILIPANEALVDNAATRRAAARMPGAILDEIPDAAHELLRERDAIRRAVLDRIDAFLAP